MSDKPAHCLRYNKELHDGAWATVCEKCQRCWWGKDAGMCLSNPDDSPDLADELWDDVVNTEYVYLTETQALTLDDGSTVEMPAGRYKLINYIAGTWVTVDTRITGVGHSMLPFHLFNTRYGGLVITKEKVQSQ